MCRWLRRGWQSAKPLIPFTFDGTLVSDNRLRRLVSDSSECQNILRRESQSPSPGNSVYARPYATGNGRRRVMWIRASSSKPLSEHRGSGITQTPYQLRLSRTQRSGRVECTARWSKVGSLGFELITRRQTVRMRPSQQSGKGTWQCLFRFKADVKEVRAQAEGCWF